MGETRMTVRTVMLTEPKAVLPEDTVPKAVDPMLQHGIRNIPVVDAQGRFLGSFTTVHLIQLLLPVSATMESGFGDVTDLTFVHDTLDDIRDRLQDVRSHKVGDYMDTKDIPFVDPDTSVIEAMLLLYKHRTHVPVVEKDTRRLVGVVSFKCILRAITGDEPCTGT